MTQYNSNPSIQIQIQPESRFELVPRDTDKSEFLDVVVFGNVAFSVDTFYMCMSRRVYVCAWVCIYVLICMPDCRTSHHDAHSLYPHTNTRRHISARVSLSRHYP